MRTQAGGRKDGGTPIPNRLQSVPQEFLKRVGETLGRDDAEVAVRRLVAFAYRGGYRDGYRDGHQDAKAGHDERTWATPA